MRIAIEQPGEADLDVVHAFLTESYWSPGIPRAIVAHACANSICALARDGKGGLTGFARCVTDKATFAWVADVFVLPAHERKGVARALVRALTAHPELQGLRRWLLATRDAHGVYAPLGFASLQTPERWMEIRPLAPYGRQSG
jgi:GNAT superfamily N-acetyltransferase